MTMIKYHNQNDGLSYIWLFMHYGGAIRLNDINNEKTSFSHRDAYGDITVFITYDDENLRNLALNKIKSIDNDLLDYTSEYYLSNHPRSYGLPDAPISIAYYDMIINLGYLIS